MNAFASLILFISIAAASMALVAYTNYKVEKAKKTTLRLQKMKARTEDLENIVLALDGLCDKRMIPKLLNDEIIEQYDEMLQISPNATYLAAGLSNAKLRSNELSDESAQRHISRVCKSDAQIAKNQAYLAEALKILRGQHSQGKMSSVELQEFALEIEWLRLQVKVISNIVQGHKAYTKQDVLGANAFYKKAQSELVSSGHPDERRHKMINQMADLLFGRRKSLDTHLMPESEFNPENELDLTPELSSSEDEDGDSDSELSPENQALLNNQQKESSNSQQASHSRT